MKKFIALFIVCFGLISMTSCSKESLYKKDEFFPVDFLNEQLIKDIPIPNGDLIYAKTNGFASSRVFIDSNDSAESYAKEVLNYLRDQNFAFIYTVDDIYNHIGLIQTKEDSHLVKEFTTLDECYFEDSWYFIYGNNIETSTNDYGTIFLKNEHVIRIKNESGVLEYDKESINFKYDYQIIIDKFPSNVTFIGN